jgi:hypothetical protein
VPSVALPFEVDSNLLFSADGRHLFARSDAADLWVVDVPEDSWAPLPAPALAERASQGFVIAAGWLDDRVATLTVRDGVLVASHGEWNVAAQASTPLEVALGPEEAPGEWFVGSEFASAHVSVSAEDRVIGLFTGEGTVPAGPLLVAHAAHESAIVAVNAARARVTVLRLDPHAKAMRCSPLEPRVAYLVDRELYIELFAMGVNASR